MGTLFGTEKEAKKVLSSWKITGPQFSLFIAQLIVKDPENISNITGSQLLLFFNSSTDQLKGACGGQLRSWASCGEEEREGDEKAKLIFEQWKEMT